MHTKSLTYRKTHICWFVDFYLFAINWCEVGASGLFYSYIFKLINADAPVSGQQVLNIQVKMQCFQYAFSLITENMET